MRFQEQSCRQRGGHAGRAGRGLTAPQVEGGELPRPLDHSASAKRQHLHQRRTAEPSRKPEGGNQGRRNLLRIMEPIQLKRRQEMGKGAEGLT